MSQSPVDIYKFAVFGARGAGKTTLVSSYYGVLNSPAFRDQYGYFITADKAEQRTILRSRYTQMARNHKWPDATSVPTVFEFTLAVDANEKSQAAKTVDIAKLHWIDYPGGYLAEGVSRTEEESAERDKWLSELTTAQMAVLVLDGAAYARDGADYLREALYEFDVTLRGAVNRLLATGGRDADLPRYWLLAMSKADALPAPTNSKDLVSELSDVVETECVDELVAIQRTLGETTTFGKHFMLFSAAPSEEGKPQPDKAFGLSLLFPSVFKLVLDDARRMSNQKKTFWEEIASGLLTLVRVLDKLDDFLPKQYQIITLLLRAVKLEQILATIDDKANARLREAAQRGHVAEALMRIVLSELYSETGRRYFRSVEAEHK